MKNDNFDQVKFDQVIVCLFNGFHFISIFVTKVSVLYFRHFSYWINFRTFLKWEEKKNRNLKYDLELLLNFLVSIIPCQVLKFFMSILTIIKLQLLHGCKGVHSGIVLLKLISSSCIASSENQNCSILFSKIDCKCFKCCSKLQDQLFI